MIRTPLKTTYLRTFSKIIGNNTFKIVTDGLTKVLSDRIYPNNLRKVFRPFVLTDLSDVKVVLICNDPYPYPGYSTGLAFANPVDVTRYSPTLEMVKEAVYKDYYIENYIDLPFGDPYEYQFDYSLKSWAMQGVLLLNMNLTVAHHSPNSHSTMWNVFTKELVQGIGRSNSNIIFILIGDEPKSLGRLIRANGNYVRTYEHPLEAIEERRQWDCNAFTYINQVLTDLNMKKIQWLER